MQPADTQPTHADLAIIGGGAAGLMAAVAAAEAGLKPVLIERKHKPGRKLLMCGNARCNLTNMLSDTAFLAELGDPVGPFARPAIQAFPPQALREWFRRHGLMTIEKRGGRVFPTSEKASDVLNCFQDLLRESSVPLILNSPVTAITRADGVFRIATQAFSLSARRVLLCTGGVTYPKTGSVGDGQKLAATLGHTTTPYRAGLVGLEVDLPWLASCAPAKFEETTATATLRDGSTVTVEGDLELQSWGLCGGLVSNATRLAARANSPITSLTINLLAKPHTTPSTPGHSKGSPPATRTPQQELKHRYRDIPPRLWHCLLPEGTSHAKAEELLSAWRIPVRKTRPLKEAMVTVGGIPLHEVNPDTMESTRCPGLFFAGEILDIDGPTGGFNLQLAFSTAHLAIATMRPASAAARRQPAREFSSPHRQPHGGPRYASAPSHPSSSRSGGRNRRGDTSGGSRTHGRPDRKRR